MTFNITLVSGVHCGLIIYIKNTLWHWNWLCTECTVLIQELTCSQWSECPYDHVLLSPWLLSAPSLHLTPRKPSSCMLQSSFLSFYHLWVLQYSFSCFWTLLKGTQADCVFLTCCFDSTFLVHPCWHAKLYTTLTALENSTVHVSFIYSFYWRGPFGSPSLLLFGYYK